MERLVALDFDGTVALTSDAFPRQGVLSVDDAYGVACDEVLGASAADRFREQGGHNHRTPAEIVADLQPNMDVEAIEVAAKSVTEVKMAVLLGQVGTALPSGALWPRLTDGFAETWSQISAEPSVGTAIISAGHEAFIAKTFQVHSLPRPGDVVTDDVVIQAGYGDFSPEERAKPNPLIMGLTFQRWRQARQILISEVSGSNILYVGDDPYKDGRLASNSRVGFELLVPTPQESRRTWKKVVAWALQDQALSSEGYSDVRS